MLHKEGNYLNYFYVLGVRHNYEFLVLVLLLELVSLSIYICK